MQISVNAGKALESVSALTRYRAFGWFVTDHLTKREPEKNSITLQYVPLRKHP